jgi:dTDP-4-dehydrorhamnose reductase
MLTVGVIGANGQLGRYVMRSFAGSNAFDPVPFVKQELDVTSPKSIEKALSNRHLDILVNTSAYHGPQAEIALNETFAVNTLGPKYLAEFCGQHAIDFAHISTDFVFGGDLDRPYVETDCPEPVNAYGTSKLAGELFTKSAMAHCYIVRVAGLYGVGGCRAKNHSNFVETILKKAKSGGHIGVVDDQIVSTTYALDAAQSLLQLVQSKEYGTYHMTNSGFCSWYQLARHICSLAQIDADLQPIKAESMGSAVRRPMYSVLDNYNLRTIGLPDLRPWQEAIEAYMTERIASFALEKEWCVIV